MFNNCKTLEELKKAYHEAIKAAHPDNGGKVEDAAAINAAYRARFEDVKNVHQNKDGELYERETDEAAADFIDLMKQLLNIPGIKIEILGCFIWISGDTKPAKEILKSLGCKWSTNKSMWYKAPKGYRRFGSEEWTIDKIRGTYRNNGTYYGKNAAGQLLLEG